MNGVMICVGLLLCSSVSMFAGQVMKKWSGWFGNLSRPSKIAFRCHFGLGLEGWSKARLAENDSHR